MHGPMRFTNANAVVEPSTHFFHPFLIHSRFSFVFVRPIISYVDEVCTDFLFYFFHWIPLLTCWLTIQVVFFPMTLIGANVGQVYATLVLFLEYCATLQLHSKRRYFRYF